MRADIDNSQLALTISTIHEYWTLKVGYTQMYQKRDISIALWKRPVVRSYSFLSLNVAAFHAKCEPYPCNLMARKHYQQASHKLGLKSHKRNMMFIYLSNLFSSSPQGRVNESGINFNWFSKFVFLEIFLEKSYQLFSHTCFLSFLHHGSNTEKDWN